MYFNNKLIIAKSSEDFLSLNANMLNRHGIITGASGSGKTVTMKVIAETLSSAGIPSIVMDIKGDLSGCTRVGEENENITKRIEKLSLNDIGYNLKKFPVRFWDVFGNNGTPLRITIKDMGPMLLTKVLGLSDAGEGILNIVFKIAEEEGHDLVDLKDLQSILKYIADNAKELQMTYGNIQAVSVSTILRKLISIEQGDGTNLFGEPNLDILDLLRTSEESGSGYINIIECRELVKNPTLYASLLVWLLQTFYEEMPEVGDLAKPKGVLFLDEAHLIFSEMSSEIIKKITQIIKLIRSKGISVFFISQSPADIPDEILAQLGNRIQHCLRAYTPQELKAVKTAASTFRENPKLDTEQAILELGTGEALVSFVDPEGLPSVVEKAKILPPQSYMGEITQEELQETIRNSVMDTKYRNAVDRVSAYENIEEINKKKAEEKAELERQKEEEKLNAIKAKEEEKLAKEREKQKAKEEKEKEKKRKALLKPVKQIGNKVMNKATSKVVSSLFKNLFK